MRPLACLMFVMLTFGLATAQNAPATRPATQPSTRPAGAENVPVTRLLDDLLKPATSGGKPLQPLKEGPAADTTTGRNAVAPGAPQLNLVREGSYVVDRTARLNKSADGQQAELVFETDGKALKDPPMIILPNLKLMQMESAVQSSSRDLRFRVTGMVTEYKGRNYILLEKVVVVPDQTQQF